MLLYLHMGIHKTGSTAVQHYFAANQEKLREQGILYPRSGRPAKEAISHGHHLLVHEIRRPLRRPARSWDALLTELHEADEPVALISSENFDLLAADEQFSAIRSRLDDFDVKTVVYLRRQDEFLHSYYCLDVLFHEESRDFADYRKAPKTEPDYRRLLSRWEDTFGRDALIVRRYEHSALVDGDVVADICDQIGVDQSAGLVRPPKRGRVNRTYSRNVINCVRWGHRAGMSEEDIAALRSLFQLIYRDRSSRTDYLSPAGRTALLSEFAASNQAVARRYLNRSDGVLFEDLDTGDEAAWHERYDGPLADLRISIEDAREALSARVRRPPRPVPGTSSAHRT